MSTRAQNSVSTTKTNYIHITLATALYLFSSTGLANDPVPFNQWSVNNGVIDASATCNAAGVTCTLINQDNGLLQQEVSTANGSYIQMILTDTNASGTASTLGFVTENFIPTNALTAWDIHNQQIIRDTPQGFEQIAKIDRVPFNDANNTLVDLLHVDIQQTLIDSEFDSSFNIKKDEAVFSSGEIYSGKSIDIFQNTLATDTNNPGNIKTAFDFRSRSGWKLDNLNNTLLIDPFSPAGEISLNNPIGWNDGDTVTSLWLSQQNTDQPNDGFALQRIDNLTNGAAVKEVSFDTAKIIDPFDWNEPTFGPPPSLPW